MKYKVNYKDIRFNFLNQQQSPAIEAILNGSNVLYGQSKTNNIIQNFSNQPCPDDMVATIEYDTANSRWKFVKTIAKYSLKQITCSTGIHTNNKPKGILIFFKEKIKKPVAFYSAIDYSKKYLGNFILFILESPHKEEYNKATHVALGPAQGDTGKLFRKHILDILNSSNGASSSITLNPSETYNLVFINAIQYQCSLGLDSIDPKIRNQNFRYLWGNGAAVDLKKRINHFINSAKSVYIVNSVTDCLEKKVDKILISIQNHQPNNRIIYSSTHPSSWYRKNCKYIK